jgi:hypothetical protein
LFLTIAANPAGCLLGFSAYIQVFICTLAMPDLVHASKTPNHRPTAANCAKKKLSLDVKATHALYNVLLDPSSAYNSFLLALAAKNSRHSGPQAPCADTRYSLPRFLLFLFGFLSQSIPSYKSAA